MRSLLFPPVPWSLEGDSAIVPVIIGPQTDENGLSDWGFESVPMMNFTPLIYAFFKPQKSFNPSANPSFSLRISRKQAEGFGFQTLQFIQQPFSLTFPDFG
ncbi:MAG: hypothetical protein PUB53_00030 [Bacteroidales bacterium]|nr:hypothetical protein [Bacteroidales bacterium]